MSTELIYMKNVVLKVHEVFKPLSGNMYYVVFFRVKRDEHVLGRTEVYLEEMYLTRRGKRTRILRLERLAENSSNCCVYKFIEHFTSDIFTTKDIGVSKP